MVPGYWVSYFIGSSVFCSLVRSPKGYGLSRMFLFPGSSGWRARPDTLTFDSLLLSWNLLEIASTVW